MTTKIASFTVIAAIAAATLVSSAARADEAPRPPASGVAPPDTSPAAAEEKSFKSFSVELNPLAATIGRYSAQVEWLPLTHHAVVLNPHVDHTSYSISAGGASIDQSLTGFGGELGYRFYTGSRGANGFYVGPSFLITSYTASSGPASTSFSNIGAALDVGGQFILGPGIVIGGGFGLQYTSVSTGADTNGLPLAAAVMGGGGVRPRFLLSVGYAF
jgi:hypothetical protein